MLSQPRQLFHCAELIHNVVCLFAFASNNFSPFNMKRRPGLQADIKEAEQRNAFPQLEKLQDEDDQLIDYLSQSLGIREKVREVVTRLKKRDQQ
jgi:hypothetical protein